MTSLLGLFGANNGQTQFKMVFEYNNYIHYKLAKDELYKSFFELRALFRTRELFDSKQATDIS